MKTNKKVILISGLIGLGLGLFISGIVLSLLFYTSSQPAPLLTDSPNQEEPLTKKVNQFVAIKAKEDPIKVDQPQLETIELEIGPTATARDITNMLLEHGVISDYDEFIAYIVEKDAERRLSHGIKIFPLNSDIETIFKILRP